VQLHLWIRRIRRNLRQLIKFGVVGLGGFVADVGGFNLLRFAGGEGPLYDYPLTAKVISTALGIVVAWLGHRYWTFSEGRRLRVHHEFMLFVAVCLGGLAITLGCLWVSHYALQLTSALADNISANVIGLGLATAFRFWAMRTHVFGHGRRKPPLTEEPKETADVH
jgi:putative flippase GtrA